MVDSHKLRSRRVHLPSLFYLLRDEALGAVHLSVPEGAPVKVGPARLARLAAGFDASPTGA